jgi:hypothetical protein
VRRRKWVRMEEATEGESLRAGQGKQRFSTFPSVKEGEKRGRHRRKDDLPGSKWDSALQDESETEKKLKENLFAGNNGLIQLRAGSKVGQFSSRSLPAMSGRQKRKKSACSDTEPTPKANLVRC